eukprot:422885-Prorocentrum_minimum.AAC.2
MLINCARLLSVRAPVLDERTETSTGHSVPKSERNGNGRGEGAHLAGAVDQEQSQELQRARQPPL